MKRAAITPGVAAVARHLDIPLKGDVHGLIVRRCVAIVESWVTVLGPVKSLPGLLDLVSAKLCLHFEIIENDSDIARIQKAYLREKESIFATIDEDFARATDAVVIRLQHAPEWSNRKYVAVVDGRGQKRYRVWFSKWHEIAHLIAEPPQKSFVFRRTETTKRDPLERLMDNIGGALAFYEPLFLPIVGQHLDLDRLTLRDIIQFRDHHASFASLHATANAIVNLLKSPTILVEAREVPKVGAAHQEHIQPTLFALPDAGTKLRAATVTHNDAATRERLYIPRNMRIPPTSAIARAFYGELEAGSTAEEENLDWWESEGRPLASQPILVEAKSLGNRTLALIRKA